MMTKAQFLILLIVLGSMFAVAGLLSKIAIHDDVQQAASSTVPSVAPIYTIVEFQDTWKMNKSDPNFDMVAVIKDGIISIEFRNEDVRYLYWKGTFPAASADQEIVSVGDKEAMGASLMGSSSESKTFTYSPSTSQLSFDLTIMGETRAIHLVRGTP